MRKQCSRRFFGHLLGGFAYLANDAAPAVQIGIFRSEKETSARASGAYAQRFNAQISVEHRQQGSRAIGHALRNMRRKIGRDCAPEDAH